MTGICDDDCKPDLNFPTEENVRSYLLFNNSVSYFPSFLAMICEKLLLLACSRRKLQSIAAA